MNQDFLAELAEYFNISKDEAKQRVVDSKHMVRKEWEESGKDSEIYYKKSIWPIYRMMRLRPKIKEFLSQIVSFSLARGDEKILDYGCGVGSYTIPLASMGFNVTAVDYQDSVILDFLNWRLKKRFLEAKVLGHKDKLENEEFDAIVFFDVLEHLDDPLGVIMKLHRALKSNGMFYLTFSPHRGMTDMEEIEKRCYPFLNKYFWRLDSHRWLHR